MSQSKVFGPALRPAWVPLFVQFDRYEAHAKYCTACQGALRNAHTVKQLAPLIALTAVAVSMSSVWMGLCEVAVYGVLNWAADRVIQGVLGPVPGVDSVSAAHLSPT